ncbi:hypothetical protein PUN28_019682 [Cardiocondyla obscurior]|uniref:Uncharacterized protein n=1 Tax=Cardiocondyla obscurior TaxID=286306 RepID=A0AAW2EBC4_9HYME
MKKLQERYLKWVLGVGRETPYMILEELQRDKLKTRMRRRVCGFEKREKRESGVKMGEKKERGFEEKDEIMKKMGKSETMEDGTKWMEELERKDKEEQK